MFGEIDKIRNNEKITDEIDLFDDLKLVAQPFGYFGSNCGETLAQAFLAQFAKIRLFRFSLRWIKARQVDLVEIQLQITFLGDLDRVPERLRDPAEFLIHQSRVLEIELVGLKPHPFGVIEHGLGLDA